MSVPSRGSGTRPTRGLPHFAPAAQATRPAVPQILAGGLTGLGSGLASLGLQNQGYNLDQPPPIEEGLLFQC
jgi:hypothetical protein